MKTKKNFNDFVMIWENVRLRDFASIAGFRIIRISTNRIFEACKNSNVSFDY